MNTRKQRNGMEREARLRAPRAEADAAAVLAVWRQQALEARRQRAAQRALAAAGRADGWRVTARGEAYLAGYAEAQRKGAA